MTQALLLLISLSFLLGSNAEEPICPSPAEFEKANPKLKTESFKAHKLKFKSSLLSYLLVNTKSLGSGGFGQVYEMNDNPDMIIKKVVIDPREDESMYIREIEALRFICNHDENKYSELSPCRSETIAPFYGCTMDSTTIYLFQERMGWALSEKSAKIAYRSLPALNRAKIMLDIVDKFIELHSLDIVHSDIKPANIMTKEQKFIDFKIIDLGMANIEGEDYVGGTDGYRPPERYRSSYKDVGLSYNEDIFALGMTLAEMEGDFEDSHDYIKGKCYQNKENFERCNNKIKDGLKDAFPEKRGLKSFRSVIQTAVNGDPKKRFQTMECFSLALIEKFISLKKASEFIINIVLAKDPAEQAIEPKSFYKKKLSLMKFSLTDNSEKSSGGISGWFASLFVCGKPTKPKKNVVSPVNSVQKNKHFAINNNIKELAGQEIKVPL